MKAIFKLEADHYIIMVTPLQFISVFLFSNYMSNGISENNLAWSGASDSLGDGMHCLSVTAVKLHFESTLNKCKYGSVNLSKRLNTRSFDC